MTRSLLALLAVAAFATPAFAQEEVDESGRRIKYKERTEIDFEGVDVSGELVKPSSSFVMDTRRNQFNPLIRFRENFDREMKESIDEVK